MYGNIYELIEKQFNVVTSTVTVRAGILKHITLTTTDAISNGTGKLCASGKIATLLHSGEILIT